MRFATNDSLRFLPNRSVSKCFLASVHSASEADVVSRATGVEVPSATAMSFVSLPRLVETTPSSFFCWYEGGINMALCQI